MEFLIFDKIPLRLIIIFHAPSKNLLVLKKQIVQFYQIDVLGKFLFDLCHVLLLLFWFVLTRDVRWKLFKAQNFVNQRRHRDCRKSRYGPLRDSRLH